MTALKTLSLRIRGVKTELEEAGLETDGMAETTSQLQAKLKALTDGKVDIMVDANSFKNTTQILREMAAEWENLTDVEQAASLELLGGKRQANTLAAILTNFDIVEDAIAASEGSAGSALAENEKVLNSIEGKIKQFKNSTELFWSNLLDDEVIKMFVQLGTEIVKLASKFGELRSVIFGILMYFNLNKKYPDDVASFMSKLIFGKDGADGIIKKIGNIKTALGDLSKIKLPSIDSKDDDTLGMSGQLKEIDTQIKAKQQEIRNLQKTSRDERTVQEIGEEWTSASIDKQHKLRKKNPEAISLYEQKLELEENIRSLEAELSLSPRQRYKQQRAEAKKALKDPNSSDEVKTSAQEFLSDEGRIEFFKGEAHWQETANKSLAEYKAKLVEVDQQIAKLDKASGAEGRAEALEQENKELEALKKKREEIIASAKAKPEETADVSGTQTINELQEKRTVLLGKQKIAQEELNAANHEFIKATRDFDPVAMEKYGAEIRQTKAELEDIGAELKIVDDNIAQTKSSFSLLDIPNKIQGVKLEMPDMSETELGGVMDVINQKTKEGQVALLDYTSSLGEGNLALQGYIASLNGGEASITGFNQWWKAHNEGLKQSSITAKAAALSHQLLNAAISMGISMLLSWVIEGINYVITSQKRLAESVEEVMTEYNNATKSLKEHSKTIEEIKGDYVKLADGVDSLGRNVSLSTDEYQRYNEIVNEIASMFPEMVSGYTAEGNAIIALKGNVDALTEAYEAEAQAARDTILVNQGKTYKDFLNKTTTDVGGWSWNDHIGYSDYIKVIEAYINQAKGGTNIVDSGIMKEDYFQLGLNKLKEDLGFNPGSLDWETELVSLQALLRETQSEAKTAATNVRSILNAYLEQDWDYAKLSDEGKNIAQSIISGFDTEFYSQFDSAEQMEAWITTNVIKPLQNTGNLSQVELAFDLQTKFNNGDIPVDQYIDQIEEMLKQLEPILGKKVVTTLRTVFGVEEENGTYQTKKNSAATLLNKGDKDKVGQFTKTDLDIIDKNKEKWAIDPQTKEKIFYSYEDLAKKIAEVKIQMGPTKKEINDAIDSIQSVFDALKDAKKEYAENGYLSVDTMQSLLELEPKYLALLYDENGQLNLNEEAFYKVAEAKIVDMGITQQKAILEQAVELATNGSRNALLEYIETIEEATVANGDFVKSQLAVVKAQLKTRTVDRTETDENGKTVTIKADLTDADADKIYKGIENQVNAVQYTVDRTIAGIRKGGLSTNSKSGSDDDKRLENIQKEYERKINKLEHQQSQYENEIERREIEDEAITADLYEKQAKLEEEKIDLYAQEKAELEALFSTLSPSDDIYYDTADAINEMSLNMQKAAINASKLRKEISELYKQRFDELGEAYGFKDQLIEDSKTHLQNAMDLTELKGGTLHPDMYKELIAQERLDQTNKAAEAQSYIDMLNDALAKGRIDDKTHAEWLGTIRAAEIEANDESEKRIAEHMEAIKQLYLDGWDDVVAAFDQMDSIYQNQLGFVDAYAERLEIANINVPDAVYEQKLAIEQMRGQNLDNKISQAYAEAARYAKEYGEDSKEYAAKMEEISELGLEKYQLENEMAQIEKQILDNQYDRFNQLIDRIDHSISQLDNMSNLIADEDVATKDGEWTDEGITRLGLAYQSMEHNNAIIAELNDQLDHQKDLFDSNQISEKEYTEKTQELTDKIWDAVNANKDLEDSIISVHEARIDLIEEGIQEEIEAMSELIDLKKEELQSERDLYNFKKDVQKQEKDIAALQRRIASMSGSTDASTIAEKAKLEAQLREAREGLDDTFYSHAMDSQSNALDDELETFTKNGEDYVKSLRESIKDTSKVIEETFEMVLSNGTIVLSELDRLSSHYGINISTNLTNPWQQGEQSAWSFQVNCTSYIQGIKDWIDGEKTNFSNSLQAPWELEEGNKPQSFKDTTIQLMRDIVTESIDTQEGHYGTLGVKLGDPFSQAQLDVTSWQAHTVGLMQTVINKAIEMGKAIEENSDFNADPGVDTKGNGNGGNGGDTTTKPTAPVSVVDTNAINRTKANITSLQEVLQLLGYSVVLNGSYDSKTKDAVWKFQESQNIKKDGWYGTTTRDHMYSRLNYMMKLSRQEGKSTKPYNDALKKLPPAMYAKGTLGTKKDEWAITDEIGDELVMYATPEGRLSYMRVGSTVVPHDLTKELINIGEVGLDGLRSMPQFNSGVNVNSNYISKPEFNLSFDSLVHVDHCDEGTLKDLEKMVDTKINQFSKQMNYAIKRFK